MARFPEIVINLSSVPNFCGEELRKVSAFRSHAYARIAREKAHCIAKDFLQATNLYDPLDRVVAIARQFVTVIE